MPSQNQTLSPTFSNSWLLPYSFLTYAFACLALAMYLAHNPLSQLTRDFNFLPYDRASFEGKPFASSPLPDFASIANTQQKKTAFFNYLRPAIEHYNQRAKAQHTALLGWQTQLQLGHALDEQTQAALSALARSYRVKVASTTPQQQVSELLQRIDELPPSIVLAQAAIESAWGTSRFALQANNLFGQWCFVPGCGIVPLQRPEGENYEVQKFSHVGAAVNAYFLNINAHEAYKTLRDIRAKAREEGKSLSGWQMAAGLESYSGRGMSYVHELRNMIRTNKLDNQLREN